MPRNTFSVGMLRGATPGLSRLAQQIGGGDTSYQQGYDNELGLQSKLGMQLAQMRNADASARAHDATAQQTGAETAILTDRPNQFREQVANFAGSDGPTVDAYRQKLRTGAAPQVPMGPPAEDGTMGVGSQQFDPALQSKLAQAIKQFAPMLFNQKDMKPDDLAQADATYNKTGLLNSAVAGAIDRNRLGGAVAATEGKPLFHVSGDGGVLDQYTGNLNEQGGLAQSTIGLKKAQTGAQDASAKNSIAGAAAHYASAENSRAHAAKTRQELADGIKTGQIVVVTDNDGNTSLLNKVTGISRPATSEDGVPLKGKSINGKLKDIPPTANAKIIEGSQGLTNIDQALAALEANPGAVGWSNMIPGAQTVKQLWSKPEDIATRAQVANIGSLVLHDRSGAAVSASEFPRLAPFIPSASDSPKAAVAKLKEMKRIAEDELGLYAGTYGPDNGYRESPLLRARTGASPTAKNAGGGKNVSVDY